MLSHMYHADFNENQGEKDVERRFRFIDIMDGGVKMTDGQTPITFS